jgi:hypothetical protein
MISFNLVYNFFDWRGGGGMDPPVSASVPISIELSQMYSVLLWHERVLFNHMIFVVQT